MIWVHGWRTFVGETSCFVTPCGSWWDITMSLCKKWDSARIPWFEPFWNTIFLWFPWKCWACWPSSSTRYTRWFHPNHCMLPRILKIYTRCNRCKIGVLFEIWRLVDACWFVDFQSSFPPFRIFRLVQGYCWNGCVWPQQPWTGWLFSWQTRKLCLSLRESGEHDFLGYTTDSNLHNRRKPPLNRELWV